MYDYFEGWTPENPINPDAGDVAASIPKNGRHGHGDAGVLKTFIDRGIANPAKTFSKAGFRERLVKAIVLDDHPFTFAEGKGTKELLEYTVPIRTELPSHQTVRRDVDKLYDALSEELSELIKVSFEFCATSPRADFRYLG